MKIKQTKTKQITFSFCTENMSTKFLY